MGRLPNFLIIGAQKAGTSWLHQKLRLHPEIFLPADKDQAFFCWCEGPNASTLGQYQEVFGSAIAARAVGEATAAYFWTDSGSRWDVKPDGYCPDVAKRVFDTLGPDTRLILSLRDPVDRAISAYLHHIAFGDLDPGIGLLDAGNFMGLIDMGFYAAHLRNWLRHFAFQQFLILDFEQDIMRHQQHTLQRVFNFLCVNPDLQIQEPQQVVFAGLHRVWQDDEVWVPLEENPALTSFEQQQINGRNYRCCVDRSTITKLREIYAQDSKQLQRLLEDPGKN